MQHYDWTKAEPEYCFSSSFWPFSTKWRQEEENIWTFFFSERWEEQKSSWRNNWTSAGGFHLTRRREEKWTSVEKEPPGVTFLNNFLEEREIKLLEKSFSKRIKKAKIFPCWNSFGHSGAKWTQQVHEAAANDVSIRVKLAFKVYLATKKNVKYNVALSKKSFEREKKKKKSFLLGTLKASSSTATICSAWQIIENHPK